MIVMALCALFHRAAMGGNSEYAIFNLGRNPKDRNLPDISIGLELTMTGEDHQQVWWCLLRYCACPHDYFCHSSHHQLLLVAHVLVSPFSAVLGLLLLICPPCQVRPGQTVSSLQNPSCSRSRLIICFSSGYIQRSQATVDSSLVVCMNGWLDEWMHVCNAV